MSRGTGDSAIQIGSGRIRFEAVPDTKRFADHTDRKTKDRHENEADSVRDKIDKKNGSVSDCGKM